ncbi:MAG: Cof-type HAD-IIB family hydrolase [Oscillospiraceae bacterium]|nr:Cof-type HAD-IIB family hydrolase [Oscillospiraceae bacterium]
MKPQLVICDVDGTLIDPTEQITPYFDELAQLLQENQVRFSIASGRCYDQLLPYIQKLDIREPVIINNGGGARQNGEALWDELFEARLVREAILAADKLDMAIFMCGGNSELAYRHNAYIQRDIDNFGRYNHFHIPLASEWETLRFEKVMITDPEKPGQVERILPYLEPYRDLLQVYQYDSRHLDIMKAGITKGGAIARLAKRLGIAPENIMAIGDSLNDVEMLREVGTGVTVGNAKEEVKRQADHVCQAAYTAGVVEAVRRFCTNERE